MPADKAQGSMIFKGEGSKEKKIIRIALIFLALFLLVILGEAVYLISQGGGFSFLNSNGQNLQETGSRSITNFPFSRPSPEPVAKQSADVKINQGAIRNTIDQLVDLVNNDKLDEDDAAGLYIEIAGVVTDIGEDSMDIPEIGGKLYPIFLVIKKSNDSLITYRFTEEEMDTHQVILSTLSGDEKIFMREIKTGDIIIAREYLNLLDGSEQTTIQLEIRR